MSGSASGWVWDHSPYKGADFICHLAVGDIVNDMNKNDFFAGQATLAKKARVSRSSANAFLKTAVEDGHLILLEDNSRKGRPNRYRFLRPESPSIWDTDDMGGCSESRHPGVAGADTGVSNLTTPGVESHDTKLNRTQEETQEESTAPASPSPRPSTTAPETETDPASFATALPSPPPQEAPAPPLPVSDEPTKVTSGRANKVKKKSSYIPTIEEVELCELLADLHEANGNTRLRIVESWYHSMRLLLTKDGPSGQDGWAPDRIETIMRWGMAHDYWQSRISTPAKFRGAFDTMRMQRNTDIERAKKRPSGSGGRVVDVAARADEIRRQLLDEGS